MRSILAVMLFATSGAFAAEASPAPSAASEPDVIHIQSGMHFPYDVGTFHRKKVTRFNEAGSDMGVDYWLTLPDDHVYVTVFIYPAAAQWRPGEDEDRVYDALEKNMICQQELQSREHELLQFHPESSLGARKTVDVTQNGTLQHGTRLTFAAMTKAGSTPNVMKEEFDLFCFATDLWTISYRFTYSGYAGADADIAQFLRDLKWPQ